MADDVLASLERAADRAEALGWTARAEVVRAAVAPARAVHARLRRQLSYLGALRRRMELRGFPPDDALYADAADAFNALHALCVRLHYLSCTSGVGTARPAPVRRGGITD